MAAGAQEDLSTLPFKPPNQPGWTPSWAHTEAQTGRKWAAHGGSPALKRSATAPFLQLRDDYRGVNGRVNGEDRMQVPYVQQIRCVGWVPDGGKGAGRWAAGAGEISCCLRF